MHVHIRLLGGFDVTVDDRPIPTKRWSRRSAVSLVKLLALQPERRLLREQVIDALWPDLLLDEAGQRLHTAAHYARTALGSRAGVVVAGGAMSLLPEATVSVDVAEFERAADAALADGGPEAAGDAAARYAGTLLPDDLYESWTDEPRDRLRLRHLELLRVAGRYEELVAADPLDEEAHLELVRDHLRHRRRQTALRSLDRMAELFRRELSVEPSPAAAALRKAAESLPVESAVPDLRSAAASAPAGRGSAPLPAPRSRMIGRGADLEEVAALLRPHRIVTITGPGGAGKSTLALALARRFQSDGGKATDTEVILAELAPVRDDAGVTRAVAEAAGVQGAGAVETATLAVNLGPRPVLLVLDNCEHLLDASAALVDAILDAGPRARVLVTSREALRVDGEALHRIGSLGPQASDSSSNAQSPLQDRVSHSRRPTGDRAVRAAGRASPRDRAGRAQLRHLSLPDLIDRLDDRLTLLVGGRPKAGQRHSALTATIEWSYRLLSEDARHVFDRLGVFPASFDLDTVQAISGELGPGEVTNLLGDLVAKNLVVHDPEKRRYRLLETIRLFAARRLDESGMRDVVTEQLRQHVVARTAATPRVHNWLSASMAARAATTWRTFAWPSTRAWSATI